MPASAHQSATSSCSFSGFSSARSWHSLGSASALNSSQRWLAKSPQAFGAAGVTDAAFQPVVVDRAGAEHRVELRLLALGVRVVQARREALALERVLREAVDDLRQLDPEQFVDRRRDVDRVGVLRPDARCLDLRRPGDDHRVGSAALVARVPLPHLERRVEGPGPAGRIVVVGLRAAEVVDVLERLLDRVRQPVEELVLVHRAVRAALARRAVVGDEDDQRVVELPALLEVVEHPSELVVGVAQEAGVDLRHPREEMLLVIA